MNNNISYEDLKRMYDNKLAEHEKAKTQMITSQAEINISIKSLNQKISELDEEFKIACGISNFVLDENTTLEELQKFKEVVDNTFESIKGKLAHYLMTDVIDNTPTKPVGSEVEVNPYVIVNNSTGVS